VIIQVEGAAPEDLAAARRSVSVVAGKWGHEITDNPAHAPVAAGTGHEDKAVDPVTVTTLVGHRPRQPLHQDVDGAALGGHG
jgi:hypothetical protein